MVEKYSLAMRLLHWVMAVLFIGMLALGLSMDAVSEAFAREYSLMAWHKSFGVLLLILIVVRILVRLTSKVPALPQALSKTEQLLAQVGHKTLYVLMVLLPLSGFIMSSANPKRYGISFFGIKLPDLPASEFWTGVGHEIHEIAPWIAIIVIVLHIAGALKHRLAADKSKDVLPRML